MKIRTIKQIRNLKNTHVLLRVDFNVPIVWTGRDLSIQDDSRIRASIPTIEYLLKKKAKVILVSHLGRPEGYDKKLSLESVAKKLESILNFKFLRQRRIRQRRIIFRKLPITNYQLPKYFELMKKAIVKMKGGQVLILENIRFFLDEAKDENNFSKKLAEIADIFVLDGFAVAHRASASVSGVAKYLPSYAGFLLEKEITGLSKAVQKPKKPFALVLGGVKMETKIPVLKNLLPKADYVLIGGGIFNTYLWAKGYKVGKSLIDKEYKKEALALLKNKKVVLPVDVVVGREDGGRAQTQVTSYKLQVTSGNAIYDIGPETIRLYATYIKKAQTIVWNGAMGYFEQKPYDVGTLSIARLVASRSKGKAFGIIGGGETLQAMEMTKMGEYVDLISTGGGAMLQFLAGKKLPGIEAVVK